jgi:phosphotransferase system HPr (HPr) family protein
MTLAAEQGSKLQVKFDGPDEEEAYQAMAELFESGFGEPM